MTMDRIGIILTEKLQLLKNASDADIHLRSDRAQIKYDRVLCDSPDYRRFRLAQLAQEFIGIGFLLLDRHRITHDPGAWRGAAANDTFNRNDGDAYLRRLDRG